MAMRQRWSVWVLQGAHAGDNAQARALAHFLGAEFVLKQLFFTHFRHVPNVFLRSNLASIDRAKSASLEPPYPDLVIAVGILIESPVTRILTNFYLTISKPLTPTKLFTDKDEAIAYLESYKSASV